jgi:hypothetical protein
MSLIDSNLDTVAFVAFTPGPVSAEFPNYVGKQPSYWTTLNHPISYQKFDVLNTIELQKMNFGPNNHQECQLHW